MSRYDWTVAPGSHEEQIAAGRFSAALAQRVPGSANWSFASRIPMAIAELLASTPEVFNVKGFGAKGDGSTDDTHAIQAAIGAAESAGGGCVFFPAGIYLVSGLTVNEDKVAFVGEGPGNNGTSVLQADADDTVLVTVTGNRFYAQRMTFSGTSDTTERGEDVTSVGIHFNPPTASPDIDAVLDNCNLRFLQDCVKINGRNVRGVNVGISNSKRGFYVPSGTPNDVRGLELYGCRFHSMSKTGASNAACIYIDPAADWQECIITAFDADDCVTLFSGFASGTVISGGTIHKARGTGIVLTAGGHGQSTVRRAVSVSGVTYFQLNASSVAGSMLTASGAMFLNATGLTALSCGGHGFQIDANFACLHDCIVQSPGQFTNDTYDAFVVTGDLVRLRSCTALQDRGATQDNKGRYGFNITGDIAMMSDLHADSAFATGQFNLGTDVTARGVEPAGALRHEAWGNAAPVAGTWSAGDIVWDTSPSAGGFMGWVCVTGGEPGTWQTFGVISS